MLTDSQKSQIGQLLKAGKTHRQTAKLVGCSAATVDSYAQQLEKGETEIGQLKQELLTELDDAVETICYYIDQRLTAKGI